MINYIMICHVIINEHGDIQGYVSLNEDVESMISKNFIKGIILELKLNA